MDAPENVKKKAKYNCEQCGYSCRIKTNYVMHLKSIKHKSTLQSTDMSNIEDFYECDCGKAYINPSGLWKHKKNCKKEPAIDSTMVYELLKNNQELQAQMIELLKEGTHNTNSNNINSNNSNFNLNVFLHEQCKDAINITDFINSLPIKLSDLESIGEIGYVAGITKIFVQGVNKLDIYKRPIHCSDLKREVLYVKNDDIWEKEEESKPNMVNAIKMIAYKNTKLLPSWIKENPACNDTASKNNYQYNKILTNATGGYTVEEEDDKINKVIKNVVKEVGIEKR